MIRVLLLDDDPQINKLTRRYLEKAGFGVASAFNSQEAVRLVEQDLFDLAIVDIMLPDGSGLELVHTFRQTYSLPVIMMTARSSIEDKTAAFRQGADDYLVKPFDPNELVMRVQAVLKRVSEARSEVKDPVLSSREELIVGKEKACLLKIMPQLQQVNMGNQNIALPKKEFQLILLLAENKNKTLTREQIIDHIWGLDFEGDLRVVDLYIDRLRKRLKPEQDKICDWSIRTVRGLGYRLEVAA